MFSYIWRLGSFLGSKSLNFHILMFFLKMNIFGSMKILRLFFMSSQNWASLSGHFYAF